MNHPALTRSRDEALNEAAACLNGTHPTPNEIAIVAHMIRRGDRPEEIRDVVIRARAIYSTPR